MNTVQAVLFDMDGVIVNSEDLADRANRLFLEKHGKVYRRETYKPLAMGKSLAEGVEIMRELFGLQGDLGGLVEERRSILRRLYRAGVSFMPGFLDFYDALRVHDVKTCIATSADPKLLALTRQKLSLDQMFPGKIFHLADVGNRSKPDPAIYLYAAARLGVETKRCVVIEDSPNGIVAAKRAGARCVALATTLERESLREADMIVASFAEIDLPRFHFSRPDGLGIE